MSHDREAALARLQEIADVLGIHVADLTSGPTFQRLWADNEFMRLWHSLGTDAGRDAALDALRRILDEERD